jgi:hypothetical protein
MKHLRISAAVGTLVFLAACSSGGQSDASPAVSSAPSSSGSPTVGVQTAIPDGIYRTRPRTAQDLVALGLTKDQIDFAKNVNEVWKKTIVYELRIKGDQFVLVATSDGGAPSVQDQGTFTVHGHTMTMYNLQPGDGYVMRFSTSNGELKLTVLQDPCKKIDPQHCSMFLVRAAYEALPFEAVS